MGCSALGTTASTENASFGCPEGRGSAGARLQRICPCAVVFCPCRCLLSLRCCRLSLSLSLSLSFARLLRYCHCHCHCHCHCLVIVIFIVSRYASPQCGYAVPRVPAQRRRVPRGSYWFGLKPGHPHLDHRKIPGDEETKRDAPLCLAKCASRPGLYFYPPNSSRGRNRVVAHTN